jgi:hypothetical protein
MQVTSNDLMTPAGRPSKTPNKKVQSNVAAGSPAPAGTIGFSCCEEIFVKNFTVIIILLLSASNELFERVVPEIPATKKAWG